MNGAAQRKKIYRYKGLSRSIVALALLCLADMLSTIYFAARWSAKEWNPVMTWALEGGTWTFIAVKLATFVPAVIFLEWYRRHNPVLVRFLVRSAIVAYAAIYVICIRIAN